MKPLIEAFNLPRRNPYVLAQYSKKRTIESQNFLFPFFQNVTNRRHFFTLFSKNFGISKIAINSKCTGLPTNVDFLNFYLVRSSEFRVENVP